MPDPLDLEAIKAREGAASAGPWEAKAYRVYAPAEPIPGRISAACWRPWGPVTGASSIEADAEFMAAARTDLPKLVAEVERLIALNRELALALGAVAPAATRMIVDSYA